MVCELPRPKGRSFLRSADLCGSGLMRRFRIS